MIKPISVKLMPEYEPLFKGYKGFYDGQFNLDVSNSLIQKEVIADINKSLNSGATSGWLVKTREKITGICLYHYLDWDSKHFDLPMERLDYLITNSKEVSDELLEKYLDDAKERDMKHISVRIPISELQLINSFTKNGFEYLGYKAMLRYVPGKFRMRKHDTQTKIRNFTSSDKAILLSIAGTSMEINRFSSDIYIEKNRIPLVYQSWLNDFISSQSEYILVAEYRNNICGFIACSAGIKLYDKFLFGRFKPGFIGLIAVKQEYRGKNVGKILLQNAIKLLTKSGCGAIYANTAMQNIGSLTAFQHEGFKVFSALAELRIML